MTPFRPALCLLAALACATHAPVPAPRDRAGGPPLADRPGAQESLVELVPESAAGALVVRAGALALVRELLRRDPDMTRELAEYLTRAVGVDLTAIEGLVACALGSGDRLEGALLLRMTNPVPPRGLAAAPISGIPVVVIGSLHAAAVPKGVVIGTERGLAAMIAHLLGKAEAGPAEAHGSFLRPLLARPGAPLADVAFAVDLTALPSRVSGMARAYGLRGARAEYRGGEVSGALSGERDQLPAVKQMVMTALALGTLQADAQRTRATRGDDVAVAVGSIIGAHEVRRLARELEPTQVEGELRFRYRLPRLAADGSMTLALAGVVAAIAIPSFVKHTRRARTAEASANVRRIFDGALRLAAERRSGPRFTFPPSTGWTPAAPCCTHAQGRCAPDARAWATPTWRALDFELEGAHAYQYRFTSQGKGRKARFVVEARGDLDCDGVFSSYRREGMLDATGRPVAVGGLTIEDELE